MINILIIIIIIIILIIYLLYRKRIESFENRINFKTYVINLDRSPDRLKSIKQQCKDQGIHFNRWRAYDGSKLNFKKLIKNNILNPKNNMMKGAIGCSMSHINLWKYCQSQKDDIILVLEDDCLIDSDFKKKLSIYIKQLPKNWDLFYLGASNINGKKISKNILIPNKIKNKNSTENTGMYAMLIKKKILPQLIKDNLPISGNIDQIIKNNIFDKINVYIAYPPLITHNNNIKSMRRLVSNRQTTTRWFKEIQNKIKIN